MLELEQMHIKNVFGNIATIQKLISMTNPPLAYTTVMNAINKGKLTATLMETRGEGAGVWLIHLPSARKLWPDRFIKENQS